MTGMTASFTLGRRAALAAVYFERFGLSLAYFCLAWVHLHRLWISGAGPGVAGGALLADIARQVIQLQLEFYVGILLLLGRRAAVLPQKLKDVAIPLAATFFNATYSAVSWLPFALRANLFPAGLQASFAAAGLLLNVAGLAVAIWAALYLGRSFGVLVEVKQVVMDGAYRRIRHPMYLGYLCLLAGLLLANGSVALLLLVPIHMGLLVYRARLEEERLCECSPEYGEYRKRSGFLFPRWRRLESDGGGTRA